MANPNTILAKKIFDKLSEGELLAAGIDETAFTNLLATGKMQAKDWDNSLVTPVSPTPDETTEAAR